MAGKLAGKIAVVTGAGTGLGRATATVLCEHGAKVAIAELNPESGETAAAELRGRGFEAMAVRTDVASEDSIKDMVKAVADKWGGIDILHNNAAYQTVEQRSKDLDVCHVDIEAWDRALDINARGAMLCSKHVIPHMLKRGGGSLIHSSSGFGFQGDLTLTSYAVSKAALIILSKSIAVQYGKQGIRSNCIQIGLVLAENATHTLSADIKKIILDAHLTPALGQPRQIADVVAFLASNESSFITGATIPVDGGFSAQAASVPAMRTYFEKIGANRV